MLSTYKKQAETADSVPVDGKNEHIQLPIRAGQGTSLISTTTTITYISNITKEI